MLKKFAALGFTVALALGGVVALLWLLSGSQVALAQSGTGVIRVATTGSDTPGCGGVTSPCQTVQYAVDQAQAGVDEIRVASGLYTGVGARPAPAGYPNPPASGLVTQVVYINKTVTIRGGYTTAFTDPPDPEANQTTLDAQGGGRVLFISRDIGPTIEGLRITGGDADGLGGCLWEDVGGGVYVISATAAISNNWVFSNTAADEGGGLYLHHSDATLNGNTVISNTADGSGGGLYLDYSDAILSANMVISNTAFVGGGLYLHYSDATLNGNTVISNTADSRGGGLGLNYSDATLNGNTVSANTADSRGGGLYLNLSDATLNGNTVSANAVDNRGGGLHLNASNATLNGNTVISNIADDKGGGLHLNVSNATLNGNTVISNTVAVDGGGLYLNASDATLSANMVISNTAFVGGGLYLMRSDATLTNNVVADNQANTEGSGLYIEGSSPRLLHTTIARNRGSSGGGVRVTDGGLGNYSTVTLTNTILVSHSVGIVVMIGNTATLESTLWHDNTPFDWAGTGTIVRSHDYTGDPLFDADGYHLMEGSAAIDEGVDAGVTTDIDGQARDVTPDLGADEWGPSRVYLPLILQND